MSRERADSQSRKQESDKDLIMTFGENGDAAGKSQNVSKAIMGRNYESKNKITVTKMVYRVKILYQAVQDVFKILQIIIK